MFFFPAATVCKHNLTWDGDKSENNISFKFSNSVLQSTIFRRVYLCSPRGLLFTSPLLLYENTISPKCQYFMNQWKQKQNTLKKLYFLWLCANPGVSVGAPRLCRNPAATQENYDSKTHNTCGERENLTHTVTLNSHCLIEKQRKKLSN